MPAGRRPALGLTPSRKKFVVRVKEVAQNGNTQNGNTMSHARGPISQKKHHDAKIRRKRRQRLVKGYLKKDYKFKIGTSRKTLIQELLGVKRVQIQQFPKMMRYPGDYPEFGFSSVLTRKNQ